MVCKVCVATLVRLAKWVFKVFLVFLAALDRWVSKDPLVRLALLVQSVCVASKANKALLACAAPLERLVRLVPSVFAARPGPRASKESRAQLVSRAILDPKA